MRTTFGRLALLVLALGLLAAACGGGGGGGGDGGGSKESGSGTIKIGSDTANDHGTKSVAGKSEFTVELDDFYFNPTIMTGQPGQEVKLELENEGSNTHNFSIDDQSLNQDVSPDQKATVTVTIPQSGEVEFYCKFHRAQGMAGELKVA